MLICDGGVEDKANRCIITVVKRPRIEQIQQLFAEYGTFSWFELSIIED
jgi:hypothetical protein